MPRSKLAGKAKTRYSPECAGLNFIFLTKALLTLRGLLQAAAFIRPSVELSVFAKSLSH